MASIGFTLSGPVVAENVRDLQRWARHAYRFVLVAFFNGGKQQMLLPDDTAVRLRTD